MGGRGVKGGAAPLPRFPGAQQGSAELLLAASLLAQESDPGEHGMHLQVIISNAAHTAICHDVENLLLLSRDVTTELFSFFPYHDQDMSIWGLDI